MLRWFTDHPQSVGESYFYHLKKAMIIGSQLIIAGIACLIHALFPFLFQETASRTIFSLTHYLIKRLPASDPRLQSLFALTKEKQGTPNEKHAATKSLNEN